MTRGALSELAVRSQWVCWRFVPGKNKPRKLPISPHTGRAASTTNPATWGTYEQARAYDAGHIGYVLTADDPYSCIDLDGCRNPETGVINESARVLIESVDSYTEISPSGTGVHTWVQASLPSEGPFQIAYDWAADSAGLGPGKVEMWDHERFITWSGQHLDSTPDTIENRQDKLTQIRHHLWPEKQGRQVFSDSNPPQMKTFSRAPELRRTVVSSHVCGAVTHQAIRRRLRPILR